MKIISSNYFQGQPGTPGPKGGTGPPVSKSVLVMLCSIAKRPPKSPPLFMQGAGSGIEIPIFVEKNKRVFLDSFKSS